MMHRYKAIGVALAAILALSALAAQAASATPLTVNEGASGTTFYTGDQDGATWIWKDSGGNEAVCPATVISASTSGASVSETTWAATYEKCSGFGFAIMHWNHNGCTYTFTEPTQIKTGEVTWNASDIHIVCPTGKQIEYTPTVFGASVCTRFVNPQTPTSGHIVGRNVGGVGANEMDVTLEITLTGIHYTGTGSVCGDSSTHSDWTWTGKSTVRAYSNGGHSTQRGITFS
jgi:hypothetical protein